MLCSVIVQNVKMVYWSGFIARTGVSDQSHTAIGVGKQLGRPGSACANVPGESLSA